VGCVRNRESSHAAFHEIWKWPTKNRERPRRGITMCTVRNKDHHERRWQCLKVNGAIDTGTNMNTAKRTKVTENQVRGFPRELASCSETDGGRKRGE